MDHTDVKDLASDDRLKIKALYNSFKAEFIGFGRRYGLTDDELKDVYQESFLALRKQALNGKLFQVKSSLKTYLFGIGKHKIYDMAKEKKLHVPYDAMQWQEGEEDIEFSEPPSMLTPQQALLREHFNNLGKKCQEVLTLFYYRGLSIAEIVVHAGYASENVVKAQKSRCMKSLKEKIRNAAIA